MLTDPKIIRKLAGIEHRYARLRFAKVGEVPVEMCETREHFREEPGPAARVRWRPASPGQRWGGEGLTAWFRGDVRLPRACAGRKVFIRARTGGEALFFVNGVPRGVFDWQHPAVALALSASTRAKYHIAIEAYAGHSFPGTQPFDDDPPVTPKCRVFEGVDIVLEREDVSAFVFDLLVLRQLVKCLDENSLRRGRVVAALAEVYRLVDADPREGNEGVWRPKLAAAREAMRPLLETPNGPTAPTVGIIGASHIDTAWLWPLGETWRKCARTFSSALNLMEQYPEMTFLQPAPCHAEVMRDEYPVLFAAMRKAIAEGRWEPNGGMWIEPDCNVPSGEAMVRQVLVAQRWTRAHFGYTADTLWLPDVFGYSAALPQILRGGGIRFFCTTKMAWNDTTRFPYDTFVWCGLDGTSVVTHLNEHNSRVDPETLTNQWNWRQHKDVEDGWLNGYGYGDGGGGPTAEMVELARRVRDLEGCPRARHTTLSAFMTGLEALSDRLPRWSGELYLELHRGTLTSIAGVKRGNRKTELALREAEFLCTLAALRGAPYPAGRLLAIWKELLTNQFHDILPGSSIATVNDEAIASFERCVADAEELSRSALGSIAGPARRRSHAVIIANSLSWPRAGETVLTGIPAGTVPDLPGVCAQWVQNVYGEDELAVAGLPLPPLGAAVVPLRKAQPSRAAASQLRFCDDSAHTPFAEITFDHQGRVVSLVDRVSGRQVVADGGVLNGFLLGEDIPEAWDNWDIDADQALKMEFTGKLARRDVVADGPLQLRIRSIYEIGANSVLTQDMVLHSTTARIDFETSLDWHEKRSLLKAVFDVAVLCDNARHEIQYGHVERPTHANLPGDRARFEVCAHKWTDLSDNGFGVALLNDCKYGVSVRGSRVGLSLAKGGVHPDPRGDEGLHRFTYSLLPHACGFTVPAVVRPAYELNVRPTAALVDASCRPVGSLLEVDAPTVIVEAVKWAEEGNAFVVRLYDAGKVGTKVRVRFGVPVTAVCRTNLLEEDPEPLAVRSGAVELMIRAFEIVTLKCEL